MASVQKPEILNDLLKNIVLSLFNQAQEEFEDRTGRKIKPSRLDTMKIKITGAAVNSAMHILDKFGDPYAKFDRFTALTNQHLPTIIGIVGEDAVVKRLDKIPNDVLNRDVIRMLHEGGAHEVAHLLTKTLPPEQRPVVEKPAVLEPPPVVIPSEKPAESVVAVTAPFTDAVKAPVKEAATEAERLKPGRSRVQANDTVDLLRGQLKTLESLRDGFNRPIAELQERILEMELPPRPSETRHPAVMDDFALRR